MPTLNHYSYKTRVYYEDTDAAGIVYYANYLKFLERARTEWLRSLGYNQSHIAEKNGIAFAVKSIEADYLLPAKLDDELTIETNIIKTTGVRIVFNQNIMCNTRCLFKSEIAIVCINLAKMRPAPIPDNLLKLLESYC